MSTTIESAAASTTTTTSQETQGNNSNENKKPDPEQLFRIHGYSIQKDEDEENQKKKYHFLHSLTFEKITSPLMEFEEVIPVRLERRKFDSFDAMNRDANRIGVYQSKVDNDITHLNDTKIRQFLNDKANMREIPGRNPISELFEVLGLNAFQHTAIAEKGVSSEKRRKLGTLDYSYKIAAGVSNNNYSSSGYSVEYRLIEYVSTGFCNRRAEGTNVWLSCCPLQPPERLKDLGQRLLYSAFVFREEKDARLKHDAGVLMVQASIRHAGLQGGSAEAVRMTESNSHSVSSAEEEKEEKGKEKLPAAPTAKESSSSSDNTNTTTNTSSYSDTLAILKQTAERLDANEQKSKQSPSSSSPDESQKIITQQQQTAAARDYYREAAVRDFTQMVDTKFWETLEKRRKWK